MKQYISKEFEKLSVNGQELLKKLRQEMENESSVLVRNMRGYQLTNVMLAARGYVIALGASQSDTHSIGNIVIATNAFDKCITVASDVQALASFTYWPLSGSK